MASSSLDETGSKLSYEVGLNSLDATLDVIASNSGRVSSLSQGLFRHLRSGIRANTGAKAGRYYFEVEVLEHIPEAPALLLVGFSTDRSSLFLGSPDSVSFDSKGTCCANLQHPPGDLGSVKRVGVLLDQEVSHSVVTVQFDSGAMLEQVVLQDFVCDLCHFAMSDVPSTVVQFLTRTFHS
eukprot:Skav202595  [mRNA]  locus=scaffold1305:210567:227184:- [translate_table: standard]